MRRTLKYVGLLMLLAVAAWAADIKISDMTAGTPAQDDDAFPIARSGANYKLTVKDLGVLEPSRISFEDEFTHSPSPTTYIGNLLWNINDIAGTGVVTTATSVAGHPGLYTLTSGAADNDTSGFYWKMASGATAIPFLLGTSGTGTAWEYQVIFKTDASDVASYTGFVGFSDTNAGRAHSASRAIGIYWDTDSQTCDSGSHSTTNFVLYTNGGNDTCTDTTVAVEANTWYRVRLWSTTAGTVNGAISTSGGAYSTTKTNSTNVPTGGVGPVLQVGTRTTSAHAATYDRFAFVISGVSR